MRMIRRRFTFAWILFFALLLFNRCKQDVPAGILPEGYISITFDDNSVDNWYTYLPLLDSLGIKATFYICKYHVLTVDQKAKLHAIQNDGHEIAYHTTNHPDLAKLLVKKGMDYVIAEEIESDLTLMRADGFTVTNFAYPYGSHTVELDNKLMQYFHSVRVLANKSNYYKCLALQACKKQLLYGPDIDDNKGSPPDDGVIRRILNMAGEKHACAVFTAHQINNPGYKYSISANRLRAIAAMADEYHLKFIPVHQITD